MQKKSKGFTLIEVIITVAIVAILGSIAFSSYKNQADKARLADGKALLNNLAQQLERCYTRFGRYNNANCTVANGDNFNSEDNFYRVAVAGITQTTYSLTAIPQGVQANEEFCVNLTLNQAGQQTFSGPGAVSQCW